MTPALTVPRTVTRGYVNLRIFDRIWHIRGSLPLPSGQSRDEAFGKLAPLFHEIGTTHHHVGDTLTFSKKDAAAQDKMSVFDAGMLQIRESAAGAVLHYHLTSRALLYCFLAPLLFLAFAGMTIALGKLDPPKPETAKEKAEAAKKDKVLPQHWIDQALGAPAPEKPNKDKGEDKKKEEDKKHSPKAAYIFAGIFAALYAVGRVLEDRLIARLFKKTLGEA